jgi:hypothetical protein
MRNRVIVIAVVFAIANALSGSAPAGAAVGGWTVVAAPGPTVARLVATDFAAGTDGWAVGSAGVSLQGTGVDALTEHWNGQSWQVVPSLSLGNSNEALTGVTSTSASNAWAVGWHDPYGTVRVHGLMLHWNGQQWSVTQDANQSPIPVAIDARTSSDVWAVGNDLFQHFDGTSWTTAPFTPVGAHLRAVTVLAADNAWAVGGIKDARTGYRHDLTYLAHWDGASWKSVASPLGLTSGSLSSVSGTGPSDIWAVGSLDSGVPVALHYNGISWTQVATPSNGPFSALSGVVAISSTNVWAVGNRNGTLANGNVVQRTLSERWDGASWSVVASPNDTSNDNSLAAVIRAGTTIWAFGGDGNVLVLRRSV